MLPPSSLALGTYFLLLQFFNMLDIIAMPTSIASLLIVTQLSLKYNFSLMLYECLLQVSKFAYAHIHE